MDSLPDVDKFANELKAASGNVLGGGKAMDSLPDVDKFANELKAASGNVLGGKADTSPNVDKFANELKAAENGIIVFASSTGNQLSQEGEEWNNGAFTKAIVEGMRGAAARPDQAAISISDLHGYVSRRVRELTDGKQRPVMAMPTTVEDYWIARRLN